ncbi:unnamed protein product [Penicillium roqueforti FM164]|uniref:Genomic scaffold, ProqFM164S03 n=1 Tax=Penicillium roqueforti (strain FM164) TaxID=1365484 RepID=W6QD80_PENRF|nr:unnamed protein product [Penicillium roqueforti FM164]
MGKQIRERETVNSALPPLLMTDFHTSSNAVHPLVYNGDLNHWPNFFQNVRATMDNQHWSSSVIGYTLKTHNLDDNKDFVGDETGVQGRFQQAIGQTLGQAFEAQRLDIRFADSKCLPNPGGKVPDCTMKTSRNELKLVGELKVPWVVHHRIERRLKFEPFCQNSHFRVLVGQILGYMKETGVARENSASFMELMGFKECMGPALVGQSSDQPRFSPYAFDLQPVISPLLD